MAVFISQETPDSCRDKSPLHVCNRPHLPERQHVESHDSRELPEPAIEYNFDRRQTKTWLEVAPYLGEDHLLNIQTLDLPNQLFAVALTQLAPTSREYATIPYELAFNWSSVMSRLKGMSSEANFIWGCQQFYVVEFRSKLKEDVDKNLLFQLDKESHREATRSGGLLKYWYGEPNSERRNLATCLWRSKEDAINGGQGPWHKKARNAIPQLYEQISVSGITLIIEEGVRDWRFASKP